MAPPRHRILFLDAYDSFTNNITALLTTLLGDVDVHVLPIDSPLLGDPASPGFRGALRAELAHYAAVVCGPGPGSPAVGADVGLMSHVWALADADLLPVLGVCLGFQSLALSCGARIRRLRRALHGMVRAIDHRGLQPPPPPPPPAGGRDVFEGVGPFRATLYHSLCADVGQDAVPEREWPARRWAAPEGLPDLLPLAWAEEEREGGGGKERILMAARHATKPFWGVQYHPESVCTEGAGDRVIANWFREALRWNEARGRRPAADGSLLARNAVRPSLLRQLAARGDEHEAPRGGVESRLWSTVGVGSRLASRTVDLPGGVQVPDLLEILQAKEREHVVLDSANAHVALPPTAADVRGRYSIVALDVLEAVHLEYHAGDDALALKLPRLGGMSIDFSERIPLGAGRDVWQMLAEFHEARRYAAEGLPDLPFLGGFMGYITYEQGLSGIGIALPQDRGHYRPDVCLVWVTKSLVVDHREGKLHIQYLHPPTANGQSWLDSQVSQLKASPLWHSAGGGTLEREAKASATATTATTTTTPHAAAADRAVPETTIRRPDEHEYEAKVRRCQEYIAAGESYELCLTEQTTITRPRSDLPSARALHPPAPANGVRVAAHKRRRTRGAPPPAAAWALYRALRGAQPAPFASYLRLGAATLVSASPERFLQYGRDGACSMKPMKGTVRKSGEVRTLAQAEAILHVPKEEAENLMIVDLVRHDMHGVCGPGAVRARDLMQVEEYQSVFQMTTAVEGRLPGGPGGVEPGAPPPRYTGLDVLAASLPPGSMTGAPKKRSCELLLEVEGRRERSLYSGVVGYMCVSGRGDWSVTIRSLFRWEDECGGAAPAPDDDDGDEPQEVWRIGAGGAVTILSTPEGEREEMVTKLAGPLGIFAGAS